MSLNGNLEDLPLLDILQIVSFSKKTGSLGITTTLGEGAIVFREGFVVASFAWDAPPIDPSSAGLAAAEKERAIRRRIEAALEQLIRLREGQFQFSLSEKTPQKVGPRDITAETLVVGINPQELLLGLARGMDEDRRDSSEALEASFSAESGADASAEAGSEEELPDIEEEAADETPGASESDALPLPAAPLRSSSDPAPEYTALRPNAISEYTIKLQAVPEAMLRPPAPAAPATGAPERPAPPAAPAPGAAPAPATEEIRALLLVDDEEDVRRILAQSLTQGGYQVVEAEDPDAAVKKANRLSKAGIAFVLVTDLGMPTSGGSSFQGGFEVVKRLMKMKLDPPVLMMTETLSPAVRSRAKQLGISSFVFKPGLSKLDPEQHQADLRAFASKLLADVLPELSRKSGLPREKKPASQASGTAPASDGEGASRDIKVLQTALNELRATEDASRISALVMKVAREFFERGVLFLIKNEEVRGLGGFGPAGTGDNITLIVRDVAIPLNEPSVFVDVVSSGRARHGSLPENKWSQYLMGRLGRFRSSDVALLPLVAHRDTIAILFGDNPETGRPLQRLDAFDVFMQQAGVAMENAILQRKLRSVDEKG